MDYDIVTRLRGSIPGDPDYVLELISEAATEIVALRVELAEAYAREALWRDVAMQAQDKVDDLLEQLYKKAVRCDCP